MPQTSNTVANQALDLVGNNSPKVSGFAPTWDSSPAGKVLQDIYDQTVAEIQRQYAWDASRRVVELVLSGNTGPYLAGQYDNEYLYPGNGVEVWEVQPGVATDKNDPTPFNATIGNTLVSGVQRKVIWTDLDDAIAIYNNNPTESVWDPGFTGAVVRSLASKLALALAGRPETAAAMGQAGQQAAQINSTRGG